MLELFPAAPPAPPAPPPPSTSTSQSTSTSASTSRPHAHHVLQKPILTQPTAGQQHSERQRQRQANETHTHTHKAHTHTDTQTLRQTNNADSRALTRYADRSTTRRSALVGSLQIMKRDISLHVTCSCLRNSMNMAVSSSA
jgi:hypothetical protein